MKKSHCNILAFSIVEVIIAIFVFTLWLISIYALISSSLSVWNYNKNAVIASNLAREQVELFINIRDTNYKKLQVWNKMYPETSYSTDSRKFELDRYYSLSPTKNSSDIQIYDMWSTIIENDDTALASMRAINGYRLCIRDWLYMPCDWSSAEQETIFYKYLLLSSSDASWNALEAWAVRLVSKIIWIQWKYHEFDISTIITDWRRI